MSEVIPSPAPGRALRVPHWDEYSQAQRFAAVMAILQWLSLGRSLLLDELELGALSALTGGVLLALCFTSDRRAETRILGLGTPLTLLVSGALTLGLTRGGGIAGAATLTLAPFSAKLWGAPRSGVWFLSAAVLSAAAVIGFAPPAGAGALGSMVADPRAAWLVPPAASALLLLARSWRRDHARWHAEVAAAHAVLAASEARFKAYVENAYDVTVEFDQAGNVLFMTSRQEASFAAPVASLLGTKGADYLHPDDLPLVRSAFAKAAKGRPNVSPPLRYRGAGEGWRSLRAAVSAYRTAQGELRFVLQARDETAQIEASAERERRIAALESERARLADDARAPCPRCGEARSC
jgi:PAS domain S-box-containing protein